MRITVTGATGQVGSRVAARLAEAGQEQILVVRDPNRAPRLDRADVRTAAGYGDREGMRAALEGADVVFLVPAAEAPDRVEQHRTAIDAAVAAGVPHVVYLSFVAAAPDSTFTLGRDHWHTEEHVRAVAPAWTFLRMNLYMDFLPAMVQDDGVIRGPAGDGRYAGVLRDDVAASAAAVLPHAGEHTGRTYDLTGPEAYSLAEAAAAMGVRYEAETDEEAFASRRRFRAPDWEIEGWVSSYRAIRDGSLDRVSPDVERLTGRAPLGLSDWLALRALPAPGAPWSEINRFASTLNGYDVVGGGPAELMALAWPIHEAWRERGELPDDVTVLRTALFAEQRRDHFSDSSSDPENVRYAQALVEAIRSALTER